MCSYSIQMLIIQRPKFPPLSNRASCGYAKTGLNFLLLFAVLHDRRRRRCCVSDPRSANITHFAPRKSSSRSRPRESGTSSAPPSQTIRPRASRRERVGARRRYVRCPISLTRREQVRGEERRSTNRGSSSRTRGRQFRQ